MRATISEAARWTLASGERYRPRRPHMRSRSAQSDHAGVEPARDCSGRAAGATVETAAPPRKRQSPLAGSNAGRWAPVPADVGDQARQPVVARLPRSAVVRAAGAAREQATTARRSAASSMPSTKRTGVSRRTDGRVHRHPARLKGCGESAPAVRAGPDADRRSGGESSRRKCRQHARQRSTVLDPAAAGAGGPFPISARRLAGPAGSPAMLRSPAGCSTSLRTSPGPCGDATS